MPDNIQDRRRDSHRLGYEKRRRYPRVQLETDGFYQSENKTLFAKCVNLSLRGTQVITPAPDIVGSDVCLRLVMPEFPTMMKIDAKVVWSNDDYRYGPLGMGLKFFCDKSWQIKRIASSLLRTSGLSAFPNMSY
jgi:Tfp pilus assembly protein PilZ